MGSTSQSRARRAARGRLGTARCWATVGPCKAGSRFRWHPAAVPGVAPVANNSQGRLGSRGAERGAGAPLPEPAAVLPAAARGRASRRRFLPPPGSSGSAFPVLPSPGWLSLLHFPDLSRTRSSASGRCPSADGSGRSSGSRVSPEAERAGSELGNCRLETPDPQRKPRRRRRRCGDLSLSAVARRAALDLKRSDFGSPLLCFS